MQETGKNFFIYNREEKYYKQVEKDGKKERVEILDSEGKPTGQYEIEIHSFKDAFNMNKVVRTYMVSEELVIVLLDDGHEESRPVQENPMTAMTTKKTGKKVEETRRREWIVSEIQISGKDQVETFYEKLSQI